METVNWALWFMIAQIILCAGGSIGFLVVHKYAEAWVWFCYSAANVGWAYMGMNK